MCVHKPPAFTLYCTQTLGAAIADSSQEELQNQVDEGEALQCLIDHKDDDDMDKKCAAGVEHFQLVR